MDKSLLLHALSLNDRILEPHSLPLHGRVWAYAKDECSRDGFIGHCLTMLSQLGLTAGGISLGKKDIVAFDAQGKGKIYTVVISLADDSLASRYFYFLGIWRHMDAFGKAAPLPEVPPDCDLLTADFYYEAYFSDQPLQKGVSERLLAGKRFGQSLYGGELALIGNDSMREGSETCFLLYPRVMG
ncbi:MAG: hypothetical protein Q9M30_03840, partial [Mariprofundaceae bacterium]|nr:hypothetical protein [Mariprofundaceae bacterium]